LDILNCEIADTDRSGDVFEIIILVATVQQPFSQTVYDATLEGLPSNLSTLLTP
jgi:hypothetical protein